MFTFLLHQASSRILNSSRTEGLLFIKYAAVLIASVQKVLGNPECNLMLLARSFRICICNDRYNKKLKSRVNYCDLLNFCKPTKQQVTLEELADRVNGDIRMALNMLQYMCLSMSTIKYDDILRLLSSAKDVVIVLHCYMGKELEKLTQGESNFNRFGGWPKKNSTTGKNLKIDLGCHAFSSSCIWWMYLRKVNIESLFLYPSP